MKLELNPELRLPDEHPDKLEAFCKVIVEDFQEELVALVLYGGLVRGEYAPGYSNINLLFVFKKVNAELLRRLAQPVRQAAYEWGLAPFILSEHDLKTSEDVFPIKLLAIKNHHSLIWGRDVLDELDVSPEFLRLHIEQQLKNLMIRLRNFYLHDGENPSHLEEMMVRTLPGLIPTLEMFLNLEDGHAPRSVPELLDVFEREFAPEGACLRVLRDLKLGVVQLSQEELSELFIRLLDLVERTADEVDRFQE